MKNLSFKLQRIGVVPFILIFVTAILIFMVLFNITIDILNIPNIKLFGDPPSEKESGLLSMIILGVIIVPLLETLIFQKLPYFLFTKIRYFRSHICLVIIISALLFGLSHTYSLNYVIYAICIGVIFMYAYVVRVNKRPFWTVFLIHALFNMIVIILETNNILEL